MRFPKELLTSLTRSGQEAAGEIAVEGTVVLEIVICPFNWMENYRDATHTLYFLISFGNWFKVYVGNDAFFFILGLLTGTIVYWCISICQYVCFINNFLYTFLHPLSLVALFSAEDNINKICYCHQKYHHCRENPPMALAVYIKFRELFLLQSICLNSQSSNKKSTTNIAKSIYANPRVYQQLQA